MAMLAIHEQGKVPQIKHFRKYGRLGISYKRYSIYIQVITTLKYHQQLLYIHVTDMVDSSTFRKEKICIVSTALACIHYQYVHNYVLLRGTRSEMPDNLT